MGALATRLAAAGAIRQHPSWTYRTAEIVWSGRRRTPKSDCNESGLGHDEASRGRTRTTAFEAKPGTSAACRGVPAFSASFSLPHLPAKISSLNAERPLSLGGAN